MSDCVWKLGTRVAACRPSLAPKQPQTTSTSSYSSSRYFLLPSPLLLTLSSFREALTKPVEVFPFPTPGTIVDSDRGATFATEVVRGTIDDAFDTRGVKRVAQVTMERRWKAMVGSVGWFGVVVLL